MRYSIAAICALSLCLAACSDEPASPSKMAKARTNSNEDMLMRMAAASESADDLASAERMYVQAAGLSESSLESRRALAAFYARHHQQRRAVQIYSEALKIAPKNTDIMRDLANAYINSGDAAKALPLLDEAIEADGKNALLHNSKGVALDRLGRFDEAQKSYQAAVALDPAEAMTFETNLSMSYILSGSYDQAIHLLLPLINEQDATPNLRQNLALAFGLKGNDENALKLALKDMPAKEAEENLKFYRMMARSHAGKKTASGKTAPPSIAEIFPEDDGEQEEPVAMSLAVKNTAQVKLPPVAAPGATASIPLPPPRLHEKTVSAVPVTPVKEISKDVDYMPPVAAPIRPPEPHQERHDAEAPAPDHAREAKPMPASAASGEKVPPGEEDASSDASLPNLPLPVLRPAR